MEESGPLRVVVKATSHLIASDGKPLFCIEKRIEAYRGAACVRIHHTLVVDRPEKFTNIKELCYHIPVPEGVRSWQVPLEGGQTLSLDEGTPGVRQRFDDELVSIAADQSESPQKARVIGSIEAAGPEGFSLAVRDFWQNYPKGFLTRGGGLDVALCPPFAAGLYDEFPFEKEGHHLYYYLLDGHYRIKQGVAKTHELLLAFGARGRPRQDCARSSSVRFWPRRRPSGTAAARRSTTWPRATPERFRLYEEAIDKNLAAYAAQRERQHDFGMMNYGDWYGERGANWGNVEYDTQHAFFLEYIRSGNPDAFFLGDATETAQPRRRHRALGDRPARARRGLHPPDGPRGRLLRPRRVPGTLGFPSGGSGHPRLDRGALRPLLPHRRPALAGDRHAQSPTSSPTRSLAGPTTSAALPRARLAPDHELAAALAATNDPYYLNAAQGDRRPRAGDAGHRAAPAARLPAGAGRRPTRSAAGRG